MMLNSDALVTNVLASEIFLDRFYSKIDPPYWSKIVYVDKYNTGGTNSIPDGTLNNPFSSLTTAFEYAFKRSNNAFIYVMWHFDGDMISYNSGASETISNPDNVYILDFTDSNYAGLTGQSLNLYGYDNQYDSGGNRRTVENFLSKPIKIRFNHTQHVFRSYGSKICIGDSNASISYPTFCVFELGFNSSDNWASGSWNFDLNGCGIKLTNVKLMQNTAENPQDRPFIEGRNYEYQLIKSSAFDTPSAYSLIDNSRICTTVEQGDYPQYSDGRFARYNSDTNSPMSGILIIKKYNEQ